MAWLLVEGRDRLHDLASRVADWMSTLTGKYSHVASAFRAGQDPILRGAPSLILAHGDANMPWNALDCAAAVSYLELALHSYGIGTCWSGFVIAAASNGVDLGIPLPEGPQDLRRALNRVSCRPVCPCSPAQARAFDGRRVAADTYSIPWEKTKEKP